MIFNGARIEGIWKNKQNQSGRFVFDLGADMISFKGYYALSNQIPGKNPSNFWNGTKISNLTEVIEEINDKQDSSENTDYGFINKSVKNRKNTEHHTENLLISKDGNVRSGPSTKYEIIGKVIVGKQVIQLEQLGSWYKVKLPNERIGWVQKSLIEPDIGNQPVVGKQSPSKIIGFLSGMKFVFIPADSFVMGSLESEEGRRNNEGPQHIVNISSFYMMTTEVTQKMWVEVMGHYPFHFVGENLPASGISWNSAQEFIQKLNQRDPEKNYRLPSEAEWEYACRAGTQTRFCNGNTDYDFKKLGKSQRSPRFTTYSVGQFSPNNWGLYDMHGNVYEWCQDWYHNSYYGAPKDGSAWEYPDGQYRVLRSGGVRESPDLCRSASRTCGRPDYKDVCVGFRLVRSP